MKRILLTVAAAICVIGTSHAQLHSRSEAYVGVKAGGTLASFIGDDTRFLRYVPGGHGGFFANLPLISPFSLQPELLYSMKGSQSQAGVQNSAGVSDAITHLSYLELPVALRASFGGLFVEAGPQAGLLLTAKSNESGENVNVKSFYRTIDFGYLLGVGYQPPKGGLGIGARYNAGLLSVLKDPEGGKNVADVRNEAFQVYLSYSPSKIHKNKKRKEVR